MAINAIENDQTDEDFFDKLVNDGSDGDTEQSGSGRSVIIKEDTDEAKCTFRNFTSGETNVSGVDNTANFNLQQVNGDTGCGGGFVSAHPQVHACNLIAEESNLAAGDAIHQTDSVAKIQSELLDSKKGKNVNLVAEESDLAAGDDVHRTECAVKGQGELDSEKINSALSSKGVKEVDWSAFNAGSHFYKDCDSGSYSDFFNEISNSDSAVLNGKAAAADNSLKNVGNVCMQTPDSAHSFVVGQCQALGTEQGAAGHDLTSNQCWENQYPGWKYNRQKGEWYQIDRNYVVARDNRTFSINDQSAGEGISVQQPSNSDYYHQTGHFSVGGTGDEGCSVGTHSEWGQSLQGNGKYPAHMLFDSKYPGWYYDTIAQQWRRLESYETGISHPINANHPLKIQSAIVSLGSLPKESYEFYDNLGHTQNLGSQETSKSQVVNSAGFVSEQYNKDMSFLQPGPLVKNESTNFINNYQIQNSYNASNFEYYSANQLNQQMWFDHTRTVASSYQSNRSFDVIGGISGLQSTTPAESCFESYNQYRREPSQPMHFSPADFNGQKVSSFSQQPFQGGSQFSSGSYEVRETAGRPPHTLVTFGFGGKLIVMQENKYLCSNSTNGNQESTEGVITVLNLMKVVNTSDASSGRLQASDYFYSLCQQSFPGPLVGLNSGSKDLNKWIDEKIANSESGDMDSRKSEHLRLLLSLLKIAIQYYGKLRSPFGTNQASKENSSPESAVAKLFASAKRNASACSALSDCLQNFPSEGQLQATDNEVQKLLVFGKRIEALQCAQAGQLWGPALVLAEQIGDQFYGDTLKKMALCQLTVGSPLRTLCLLIARQPADIFSYGDNISSIPGTESVLPQLPQAGSLPMLDEWEENLAIITANRIKDDELVIIHLGDCLCKEKSEVIAAHICYLVAEANLESYSNSARLCLIGADHWRCPRTYASPEAIQRTELYEFSKVLGNSQFLLLPFQPYKFMYAHMLAEVGKISESLKYCQAILKCLKTSGAPEVDTWKVLVSSLEDRLKIHQQGGYSANLAPAKFVGKLLNLFGSADRAVGGLPPPIPTPLHSNGQENEHNRQQAGCWVSNSTMSSLMIPSASMQHINELTGERNRIIRHNRSISEPDIGKSPSKERASFPGGSSRFGRFGSQLFQKTVGLVPSVLKSKPERQAKLGEENKFYYDERLKRWVEKGTETSAEETVLAPPPTTATFQKGVSDQNDEIQVENIHANSKAKIENPNPPEINTGIPPIPPSSNCFSAHGRTGVRARYVDTFNTSVGSTPNFFQPPAVGAAKPGVGSNAKFFLPAPTGLDDETVPRSGGSIQKHNVDNEETSTPLATSTSMDNISFPSPARLTSSVIMHHYPSFNDKISRRMGSPTSGNKSVAPHSRCTASWSGSYYEIPNVSKKPEIRLLGEELGMMPSSSIMCSDSLVELPEGGNDLHDELRDVEL